jgi:outer membrane protein assembly factor BamE (lipoprotein component of BamABCDE complex)
MALEGKGGQQRCVRDASWLARLAVTGMMLVVVGPSCSRNVVPAAILDPGKVASVVVGRSSRADVFATLGRPSRTERSASGEAWIYEAKEDDAGGQDLIGGAAAVSGVVGAFVPYAGLVGSGLGLAGTAMGGSHAEPRVVSLAVAFGEDGIVRDCIASSTALPAGVPGAVPGASRLADCQRPRPAAVSGQ